jgi:dihydrofolate reductase
VSSSYQGCGGGMIISLIVAVGLHNQLGLNNKLPWSLKDDMKNFKKLTLGHTVLMGRKTFESIGKPLPKRMNIIITRNVDFLAEGCEVFNAVENGINFAKNNGEDKLFIIGGGEIYKYCLKKDLIEKIYVTKVDFDGIADAFFPELDMDKWELVKSERFSKSNDNEFDFRFEILKKSVVKRQYDAYL